MGRRSDYKRHDELSAWDLDKGCRSIVDQSTPARRRCGPCRKAGDDRRGVYCRVCQVNDMLCEIDEWPTFEAETRDTQREDGNDESQT